MIRIKVDPQSASALKQWLDTSKEYKKAADKAMEAECQRMLRKMWTDQQKSLLNMEARRLAQWLRAQRG